MNLHPGIHFHKIVEIPEHSPIHDFSTGTPIPEHKMGDYGIGRYDERRPGIYTSPLFQGTHAREVHMGIDLFAPVGTPLSAFMEGKIFLFGYNGAELDYGNTLVTEHAIDGVTFYALYGHLSARSIEGKKPGQPIQAGETIAWIGNRSENGGWLPHVHFQLSYEKPLKPDLPGVVSLRDRERARLKYPDPRLVLGPIY